MAETADGMAETADRLVERHWTDRAREWFWISVWLVFLIGPVLSLPELDRPAVAAAGLAGFVLLYLAVARSCWNLPAEPSRPSPAQLAGLGLLAALGVALVTGYGGAHGSWRLVLIYVGAAGVLLLPAPRATWAWLAGTAGALLVIGTAQGDGVADLVLLALMIVLVGVISVTFRRMQDLVAHLHRTREELAEAAVATERLRFARDLHDLLGHTLSLIVVKAEVVARAAGRDPPTATREASEIQQIGRRALAEVREAVTGYREQSLATELHAARTVLSGAGLAVTVRAPDSPLPAPVDRLFGWVVREAATNVVRHSHGRRCEIEVRRAAGQAILEVRDDGAGGDAGAGGRGLPGLAERLAEAGGQLEAGAAAGGGWRLAATVPVGSEP